MDALEFLMERRRLCSCYEECISCPLNGVKCNINNFVTDEHYSKIIATVEKWSKEHPIETRQSVFLEQFPNVKFDTKGIINISPCQVDQKQYPLNGKDCCRFQSCFDCRREFWMQEDIANAQ